MATITELLSQLQTDKNNLVANLISKGVEASETETFTSLVPKVLAISTGIDTSDATATAADMKNGVTAYVNGEKITGTIPSKESQTYTPTTENQIINSGQYIAEDQIILGDINLISSNIKANTTIFGVTGDKNIIDTTVGEANTASSTNMLKDTIAFVNGQQITGTCESIGNTTITPSTETQTITGPKILQGNKTIQILGDEDLIAENIKKNVDIFGVVGSLEVLDTSDADATADDILLNKTAYVNGEKIIGTITSLEATEYIPTVINQTINFGQYLSGNQVIKGDINLLSENIKNGVTIFGVTGSYEGSSATVSGTLIDTSSFTSKDETVSTYGSSIYISESTTTDGLTTLSDIVAKYGGTSSSNNYIGDSSSSYGINMSNWTDKQGDTTLLMFDEPLTLSGDVLFSFVIGISSWMNASLNIRLVSATGNTQEEIIANLNEKIANSNYDYSKNFAYPGSASLTEMIIKCTSVPSGTYYLIIDGTKKADNSNTTFIKVEYANI